MNAAGVGAPGGRHVSDDHSIRVRVQRSGVRGNPLSTFIAPMFGIDTVDIGADGNRRSLAGERDDVRQAVYRSRQMDRESDAAVGSGRHVRRRRQQGEAARQSRHLHSARSDRATPATTP